MTSSDSNILIQFYYVLKVQCFGFHLRGKSLFLDKDSQNYRVLLFCKKFPWFWLIFADLGSKFDDVITFLNFFRHFLAELIKLNIFAKNYENCTFPSENMRVVQICTTPPKMGVSETPPKIGLKLYLIENAGRSSIHGLSFSRNKRLLGVFWAILWPIE